MKVFVVVARRGDEVDRNFRTKIALGVTKDEARSKFKRVALREILSEIDIERADLKLNSTWGKYIKAVQDDKLLVVDELETEL